MRTNVRVFIKSRKLSIGNRIFVGIEIFNMLETYNCVEKYSIGSILGR